MKKLVHLAIFHSLTCACFAQEFQGAADIIRQIAERSGKPAEKASDPVSDLREQIEKLKKDAAALPPTEAAKRWGSLLDTYLALPQDQIYGARRHGDYLRLDQIIAALPPPASWDEIGRLMAQRKTENPAQDEVLRLLAAVLRGDAAGRDQALEAMRASLKSKKGMDSYQRSMFQHNLDQTATILEELTGSGLGKVVAFEKELETLEKGDVQALDRRGSTLQVPDLVRFSDEKTAAALLTRAIKSGRFLYIEGKSTNELAAALALKHIDLVKRPLWQLVTTLDHAPLYEALAAKFPDGDDRGRAQAAEIYVLALVAADRVPEAVKLVLETPGDEEGKISINVNHLDQMNRQGLGKQVHAFLHQLLSRDATLPYWASFIGLSARQGASGSALKLLQDSLAKPAVPAPALKRMQAHYYEALLAADQREEGVRVLRELVKAGPQKEKSRRTSFTVLEDGSSEYARLCVRLAKVGSLLNRPEVVTEAINAATAMVEALPKDSLHEGIILPEVIGLLLDHDRGPKAEQLLAAALVHLTAEDKKKEAFQGRRLDQPLDLLSLVYSRAGRHKDVVEVFERMPYWSGKDLAALETNYARDTPLLVIAAGALAENGRQDEARRIIRRAAQHFPSEDAMYTLLLSLEAGQPLLDLLDELANRDRFEERPLIWKARVLLDTGKVDEAERVIKAAIAIDPSDGEQGKGDRMRAYAILAEVLEKKGDAGTAKIMRGAVSAIRKSEEADDWWEAGLLSEAVRRYEAALLDFADAYCIQSRLALRYSEMGDFDKAEKHYLRAFELMPDSFGRVESHCFGCEGAFRGPRAQGAAEKVFTKLASLPPVKPQVHYLVGYLRQSQGRPAEAAEAYRQAVKADPDYLNAWKNLAGLAESAPLTHEESEAATLQVFRLDPAGKHSQAPLGDMRDLRQLWTTLLAAEAGRPAKETGPLLTLTAAKARIESEPDNEEQQIHFMDSTNEESPRQHLLQNKLVSTLVQFIENLRSN
ncbi:MAG: tetratricopeptide repeat protein [Prosthecobacter sp.]